jgi:hypothetical protein
MAAGAVGAELTRRAGLWPMVTQEFLGKSFDLIVGVVNVLILKLAKDIYIETVLLKKSKQLCLKKSRDHWTIAVLMKKDSVIELSLL